MPLSAFSLRFIRRCTKTDRKGEFDLVWLPMAGLAWWQTAPSGYLAICKAVTLGSENGIRQPFCQAGASRSCAAAFRAEASPPRRQNIHSINNILVGGATNSKRSLCLSRMGLYGTPDVPYSLTRSQC